MIVVLKTKRGRYLGFVDLDVPGEPFIVFGNGPQCWANFPHGVVVYVPGQGPSQSILMVP